MTFTFRKLALFGFLACAAAMAFALYLELVKGEVPCPLCIFERIAMIGTGVMFLIATLHAPRGRGRWGYAVLTALVALVGVGLAARHIWLQSLPPGQVPACGPALGYLLKMLPVTQVVQLVLKGDGSCAVITSRVFGVSLPIWVFISFIGLALYALVSPILAKRANGVSK